MPALKIYVQAIPDDYHHPSGWDYRNKWGIYDSDGERLISVHEDRADAWSMKTEVQNAARRANTAGISQSAKTYH